jgi:hypothetical protein
MGVRNSQRKTSPDEGGYHPLADAALQRQGDREMKIDSTSALLYSLTRAMGRQLMRRFER